MTLRAGGYSLISVSRRVPTVAFASPTLRSSCIKQNTRCKHQQAHLAYDTPNIRQHVHAPVLAYAASLSTPWCQDIPGGHGVE